MTRLARTMPLVASVLLVAACVDSEAGKVQGGTLRAAGDLGSISMVVHEYMFGDDFTVGALPICATAPVSITAIQLLDAKGVALTAYTVSRPSLTPDVQPAGHRGPISDFDKQSLKFVSSNCGSGEGSQFLALQLRATEDGASTNRAELEYATNGAPPSKMQIPLKVTFCHKASPLPQCL